MMRDAALEYARCGWHVLPLVPGEKRPHPGLVPHGLHDASSDLETVRGWWQRCPRGNVGIRTGQVSGLLVVDIDGEEAAEAFRGLQRRYGAIPPTLWATTPRGGWHAYHAYPDGGAAIGNTAGRLAPGIDTRGNGGYVVAPPSVRDDGHAWAWYDASAAPVPLPGWLLRLLEPPTPREPVEVRVSGVSNYARAALEGETRAVAQAPRGVRNHTLNRAAFALGGLVAAGLLDEAETTAALTQAGEASGLPPRETHRTVRSGLEAGLQNPREVRR